MVWLNMLNSLPQARVKQCIRYGPTRAQNV